MSRLYLSNPCAFFPPIQHTAMRVHPAPGFPCALCSRREPRDCKTRVNTCRGSERVCFPVIASEAKLRRVGKGALAPCPPITTCSTRWARFALPTLRISQTCSLILTARFRLRFAISLSLSLTEGAGKAGRRLRPHRRVRRGSGRMHTGLTGTAETSRLSPREWLYGLYVLSPVSGLYCHRCRRDTSRQIDARVAAPGPHDFAVRCRVLVRRKQHA